MICLGLLLTACTIVAADRPEQGTPLHYVRQAGNDFVPECEVSTTTTADGSLFVSRTERPGDKMTLTLHQDRAGHLTQAEALLETAAGKRSALLTVQGTDAQLKRAGITDFLKLTRPNPVVTTAPDWSDIFQLVRRYDGKAAGRQEFAGIWIHPVEPLRLLTFSIERLSQDAITVKNQKVMLDRYRVRLRNNVDYLAWAEAGGRVCKILPLAAGAPAVVLEGYEAATRGLQP